MRPYFDALRAAAEIAVEADRETRRNLVRVKGRETRFTTEFLTQLRLRLNGFEEAGLHWKVVTYEPDKETKEEDRTGADMLIALNLHIDDITIQKGFLAQAKINTHPVPGAVRISGRDRLVRQCDAMLFHSPESFVFLYGQDGTSIAPALGVHALDGRAVGRLQRSTVQEFFYDFFTCWVGDRDISADSPIALQTLAGELAARRAAYVEGHSTREPVPRFYYPGAPFHQRDRR